MSTLNAKANAAYNELIAKTERENPGDVWAGFEGDQDAFETGYEAGYEAAPVVDREALIVTLHEAGAYCGDCNYEDWDLCEDCLKVLGSYADAVLALLNGGAS